MNDAISRSDLLEQVVEKEFDWRTPYAVGYNDAVRVMREKVWSAPSIDAVTVVHAKWIKSDFSFEKYKCSSCGCACWYYDYEAEVARSRFCPSCGAKMDGDPDG